MEDRKEVSPEVGESRRAAVKKMAYVAPIVLSLAASAVVRPRRVGRSDDEPSNRHQRQLGRTFVRNTRPRGRRGPVRLTPRRGGLPSGRRFFLRAPLCPSSDSSFSGST